MRIIQRIALITGFGSVLSLIIMMFMINLDIFKRMFFGKGLPGTLEIAECLMVGCSFLAFGWTQVKKQHISIDFIYEHFNPRVKSVVNICNLLFIIAFCIILFYASGIKALESLLNREYIFAGTNFIKLWPARTLLFVGVGTLVVALFSDLYNEIGFFPKKTKRRIN